MVNKKDSEIKETDLGEIPEGWDAEVIADLPIDIIDGDRGKNYPPKSEFSRQGFCLFLNTKNVPGEHFDFSECDFIGEERDRLLRKGKLQKGDIVLTTRGTVGNIAYYHERIPHAHIRINSGMVIIRRVGERFDAGYLYHLLKSPLVKQQYLSFATGSAQPQLPIRDINKIELTIPPISEQRAIAKILSDLDDKIELNNQMNKTLESIAQAIFKQWFIDFEFPGYEKIGFINDLPEGWREGRFAEIISCIRNQVRAGEHLVDRKYIPIECMPRHQIWISDYKDYQEAQSSLITFEKGDILFGAMRAYFHRVNYAPFAGITRTTAFVLRPKEPMWLGYALFLLNLEESVEYANSHSKGSTMPYAVWENSLENMPVILPPERIIADFSSIIVPYIELMNSNVLINIKLTSIRDSLLPKLMSGKIRVQN